MNPGCSGSGIMLLVLEVDHVRYLIDTVARLDANLERCLPSHRDALLDARATLYPNAPNPAWARQERRQEKVS